VTSSLDSRLVKLDTKIATALSKAVARELKRIRKATWNDGLALFLAKQAQEQQRPSSQDNQGGSGQVSSQEPSVPHHPS